MTVLRIPDEALAGEIEFAMAFLAACNPGKNLLADYRQYFAEEVAKMIAERAGNGLSGMSAG